MVELKAFLSEPMVHNLMSTRRIGAAGESRFELETDNDIDNYILTLFTFVLESLKHNICPPSGETEIKKKKKKTSRHNF